jgi:hypothetical protein
VEPQISKVLFTDTTYRKTYHNTSLSATKANQEAIPHLQEEGLPVKQTHRGGTG